MSSIQSKSILKSLSNPVVWFGLVLVIFSFYNYSHREEGQIIRSDMRGYYAYLPAILNYHDPSFQSNLEAEAYYLKGQQKNENYLVRTKSGSVHNKYFPGVAVLQAPFYATATVVSWSFGRSTDGYSKVYQLFFQIGATFYALLGLLFFYSLLKTLFPDNKKLIQWLIPIVYLATPLFHYSANTLSFSHSYSFFLFSIFACIVLKMRKEVSSWHFLGLGMTLGMIVIVRPTNLIIVLMIPFLLERKEVVFSFFKQLFERRGRKFGIALIGFILVTFHLFLIWKWESGSWFVWSYGGEGFNFLHPAIFSSLFSFRIGLFLHTPALFLSVLGLIYLYRTNKFQMFWWVLYFILNAWVISSWWCWDYESAFGNRPYTEHLIFILLPLFVLMQQKKIWPYSLLGMFLIVGFIRLTTFNNGFMVSQRFTSNNYFESLVFWNNDNFDRWNYTKSCHPYGEKIDSNILVDQASEFQIDSTDLFVLSGKSVLHMPRTNERFYYRVVLDKKTSDTPLEDVMLVVDVRNLTTGESYYSATPLYNDKLEGIGEWAHVEFESLIPDNLQKLDHINIYIWNRGGKEFSVRNFKIILEEYKN